MCCIPDHRDAEYYSTILSRVLFWKTRVRWYESEKRCLIHRVALLSLALLSHTTLYRNS